MIVFCCDLRKLFWFSSGIVPKYLLFLWKEFLQFGRCEHWSFKAFSCFNLRQKPSWNKIFPEIFIKNHFNWKKSHFWCHFIHFNLQIKLKNSKSINFHSKDRSMNHYYVIYIQWNKSKLTFCPDFVSRTTFLANNIWISHTQYQFAIFIVFFSWKYRKKEIKNYLLGFVSVSCWKNYFVKHA